MAETLLTHQNGFRLAVFALVLALMLAWEGMAPRRARTAPRWRRWPGNLAMVLLGGVTIRIVFPVTAVAWAALLEGRGIGVLTTLGAPSWIAVPAAIVLLDLIIWAQHVVFHRVPVLWRLHRMHHADTDLDVTSGTRFHPLEILLSMALKFAAIAALGAPAVAVLVFEILLNGCAMFNHANAAVPARLDRWLRRILVTPDMHRIHHSWRRDETDSNFGFCLPWWDRLFGTYRVDPADGQTGMTIGLAEFRDPVEARLDRMLTQPFREARSQTVSAP